jgi:hypothetical protein
LFDFVFKWVEFKAKMAQIETFNLNENLMLDYDGNVPGLEDLDSFEDTWLPIVALVSTPSAPSSFGFKSITTLTILDLKAKVV